MKTLARCAKALAAGVLMAGAWSASVLAADLPAMRLLSGTLTSPATAWTTYGSSTTHTNGVGAGEAPEILAQARALNPPGTTTDAFAQNVADYVRNNIDVEFRFGLGKGGRGALIDQSGTPFDQAELMYRILKAGGLNPEYRVATTTLTSAQFGKWTGLVKNLNEANQTFQVDAKAACQFLADGAIPASIGSASSCATISGNVGDANYPNVTLAHVWVAVNGKLYDPSFKQYRLRNGIDIAARMGCGASCGTQVRDALMSGSTSGFWTGTSIPYRQSLNTTGMAANLAGKAQTLAGWIEGNLAVSDTEDVVGRRTIDVSYGPTGISVGSCTAQYCWTGAIPDQFRTRVQLTYGSINLTLWADELAGKRVRLQNVLVGTPPNTSQVAHAYLENVSVASTSTLPAEVTLALNLPYAPAGGTYGDVTLSYLATQAVQVPMSLVLGLGAAGEGLASLTGDLVQVAPGPGSGSMRGLGNEQPLYASRYLAQASRATGLVEGIQKARITSHFALGFAISAGNPGSADPGNKFHTALNVQSAVSATSATAAAALPTAALENIALISATLEGSVFAQMSELERGLSAPSTFAVANGEGTAFLYVPTAGGGSPGANMATAIGVLQNYGGRTAKLQASANDGYGFILPQNGNVAGTPASAGCGLTAAPGPSYGFRADRVAQTLAECFKGGTVRPGVKDTFTVALDAAKAEQKALKERFKADVSLATGALTISAEPDIVTGVGDMPNSLPFQRFYTGGDGYEVVWSFQASDSEGNPYEAGMPSYSGSDSTSWARLGGGWSHTYQITGEIASDGAAGLGRAGPLPAVRALAGLVVLRDLQQAPGFDERLTAEFVGAWIADQFIDNAVTVTLPPRKSQFYRTIGDNFIQPGLTGEHLTWSGAKQLIASFSSGGGLKESYDYSGVSLSYFDRDGSEIRLHKPTDVAFLYNLTAAAPKFGASAWIFPNGQTLSFDYGAPFAAGSNDSHSIWALRRVDGNTGRFLSFGLHAPAPGAIQQFTEGARITSVTAQDGRTVTFSATSCPVTGYGGLPALFACNQLSVTSPIASEVTRYAYDSSGVAPIVRTPYRMRSWFTPGNTITPYAQVSYDALYRAASITDIGARTTSYYASGASTEWWKAGVLIDAVNARWTTAFDQGDRPLRETDPLNRSTTYAYDAVERELRKVLPEGNAEVRTYDLRSNVLTVSKEPKPGPALAALTTTDTYLVGPTVWPRSCGNYRTCNKLSSRDGPRTDVTDVSNFSWSGNGDLTQVLAPADDYGQRPQTDYGYSIFSAGGGSFTLLTSLTEKISPSESVITLFGYNPANHHVPSAMTVDPSGLNYTTTLTIDPRGNVTAVDGPRTDVTDVRNFTWDDNRRLVFVVEPDPDGAGPLLRPTTRNTYDLDGQRTRFDQGTSTSSTGSGFTIRLDTVYTYDAIGNLVRQAVAPGQAGAQVTQFNYDAVDRQVCTAVRMNPASFGSLPSDACALASQGVFGPDLISKKIWTAAGELQQLRQGVGTSLEQAEATYTYFGNGTRASLTDARNNATTYSYDRFDRAEKIFFPDGTFEQNWYDQAGNNTNWLNRRGFALYRGFDALNRMSWQQGVTNGVPNQNVDWWAVRNATFLYDLKNRRTAAVTDQISLNWAYDKVGRVTSHYNSWIGNSFFNWDAANNRIWSSIPSGLQVYYQYDALNRMTWVTTPYFASPDDVLGKYEWDELSRRTKLWLGTNRGEMVYGYDTGGRLSSIVHGFTNTSLNFTETYAYDPASREVSRTNSSSNFDWNPAPSGTYYGPADAANRYWGVGAYQYFWSNGGGLAADGERFYRYDEVNKLKVLFNQAGTEYDVYNTDANGHVFWRPHTLNGVNQTALELMTDGVRPEVVHERIFTWNAGAGSWTSQGTRLFVTGVNPDERLVMIDGAGSYGVHVDRRGSALALSSGGGILPQNQFRYGPYGESSDPIGDLPSFGGQAFAYRYTGQRLNAWSRLYDYKARDYSTSLGRFLQPDPILDEGGHPNLFTYVRNNPVNRRDPTGMCWTPSCPELLRRTGQAIVNEIRNDPIGVAADVVMIAADVATIPSGEGLAGVALRRGAREAVEAGASRAARDAPDFVVGRDGTAMRPTARQQRADFESAGMPGRPTTQTQESGTIHTTPDGRTDVRVMDGGGAHPPRAVTTRSGTNDPVRPNGQQFPSGTPRQQRRDESHRIFPW